MTSTAVAPRRCHYENAFEDYLTGYAIPFVNVSDVRTAVGGRLGVKAFDYIVYPPNHAPCLVDVKGRKSVPRKDRPARRWDSWVTQGDVDGMLEWTRLFGPDFTAAFVFGYWTGDSAKSRATEPEQHALAGRIYSLWAVDTRDYVAHAKQRSPKWKTLDLPTEQFIRLAFPLSRWTAPVTQQ